MMNDKCSELFKELRMYSDDECIMNEFILIIKSWVHWNRGEIRITLIDLHQLENKFPNGHLYIGYDDCSCCCAPMIYSTDEFIDYIEDVFNDYDDEEYFNNFWEYALTDLLYD